MNRFNPGYFTEDELRDFGIASVGVNVRVARNCTIIGLANISIGDNVRIDGYSTITASGEGFSSWVLTFILVVIAPFWPLGAW